MKKRDLLKKDFLNKLDSIWGNWYVCPLLLREFSAFWMLMTLLAYSTCSVIIMIVCSISQLSVTYELPYQGVSIPGYDNNIIPYMGVHLRLPMTQDTHHQAECLWIRLSIAGKQQVAQLRSSAIAEGPRDLLISLNLATTNHPVW